MSTASDVADTLYALPPQAFTAARDEQVAAARNAGDRPLAAELSALKRPSVAAWLVNLVALRRPDALESLVQLGETIRDAQGTVTATQLRDLSTQRRAELDTAVGLLRSLAAEVTAEAGGTPPNAAQVAEAEGTLAAAMADPGVADQVRAARLLKPLTYSGFGGAFGAGGAAAPARPTTLTRPTPTRGSPDALAADPGEAERAEAARLAAAQGRVDEAGRTHAATMATEQGLARQAEELAAQITDLTARLDGVHREARSARQARLVAERELASAQRRLDRLR